MPESDILQSVSDKPAQLKPPIKLAYLLIDDFALMSYAPVMEPFRAANMLSGKLLYEWRHYSVTGAAALASSGVSLGVNGSIDAMEPADIILVCAGGNPTLFRDERTFDILRRAARFGSIVGGVSGGPFVLARAGLLDGFRCTIHWEHEQAFVETFSKPRLERSLFVVDGKRVTCAGGIAGLDLASSLIAAEHGSSLANKISDWYIQPEQRLASRPQRRSAAQRYRVFHKGLIAALTAMDETIAEPLSRARLAAIAGVSVRQMERLFRVHLNKTVGSHYLRLRLEKARKLLEETDMSIMEASTACGFASANHFSKAFKRQFSVLPSNVRRPIVKR